MAKTQQYGENENKWLHQEKRYQHGVAKINGESYVAKNNGGENNQWRQRNISNNGAA
jgi:hypothetical protein